ncbi:MAG: 16S rRNA (guanine(527)-N(7))-methyltransferase RsmG [Antricoccus sp.]
MNAPSPDNARQTESEPQPFSDVTAAAEAGWAAAAADLFGDRLSAAVAYHDSLATAGSIRGLNGPREVPVLWDRHLINSALLALLPKAVLPHGATVCDVGSGAGLPGIPLALARPDLYITLLDPLERRINYLNEIVAELDLPNVVVQRGRADYADATGPDTFYGSFNVVTSRAVAPLKRLLAMCLPLVGDGGVVLAMKGRAAEEEIAALSPRLRRQSGSMKILECNSADKRHSARVIVAYPGAKDRSF